MDRKETHNTLNLMLLDAALAGKEAVKELTIEVVFLLAKTLVAVPKDHREKIYESLRQHVDEAAEEYARFKSSPEMQEKARMMKEMLLGEQDAPSKNH